eukprot:CAMPEP_0180158142 /NCGR_PEP_ID=MMETSP0986-20121125/26710_1 /TAXON_ID=697907 /ORGANISM="non described non described, Strain CCMP2293" /LENGTH=104 /DNA_ID=CAMNT_0022107895 /DNA_START=75 /DNA_END=389 /DNA_ORIENTATION=+
MGTGRPAPHPADETRPGSHLPIPHESDSAGVAQGQPGWVHGGQTLVGVKTVDPRFGENSLVVQVIVLGRGSFRALRATLPAAAGVAELERAPEPALLQRRKGEV